MKREPKLRTVEKVIPPYKLNFFPKDFAFNLGKEIVYILATKSKPELEGKEWEEIFASCINADWKPSNVGLDDIVLGSCAWGAKSVKSKSPSNSKIVRLISGRNSPIYSYGKSHSDLSPNELGELILGIWNERVSSIRSKFKHVRTVVLVKSYDLTELCVFETETIRYNSKDFIWRGNTNNNFEGC